ncbi:MAG: aminopeptidase [Lachnospiraceae bacterium]|nr:aminopeptidase [Lachnospiraceae bacterium]
MESLNYNTDEYKERLTSAFERIAEIKASTATAEDFKYHEILHEMSSYLISLYDIFKMDILNADLETLEDINKSLYEGIMPEAYEKSFLNPDYTISFYKEEDLEESISSLLLILFTEIKETIPFAFEKNIRMLTHVAETFLEIYFLLESKGTTFADIKEVLYYYVSDYSDITVSERVATQFTNTNTFCLDMVMNSDLTDLRYLYRYGDYISNNEIETAKHLNEMSDEKISSLARTFTEGYKKGFILYDLPLDTKKTVNIRYNIGFERIVREEVKQFKEMGLDAVIYRAYSNLSNKTPGFKVGVQSTSPNPQYDYDHRFDNYFVMDKAYIFRKLDISEHTYEELKTEALCYAGPAVMEVFGEDNPSPILKKTASSYSLETEKLYRKYRAKYAALVNKYIPGDTTSFSIIAYPIPAIGKDYKDIFDDTVRINTLDIEEYESIQTELIKALDQAEKVHITGHDKNKTDLYVSINTPNNPEKETAFENCLADVNIPLGEVFTSPVLEGTTGVLNVTDIYLNGLRYTDLTLHFKDGMVIDYSCSNFNNEAEGQKYIFDNILHNHASLPMGEFAIGTNTEAYKMALKYNILPLMPILITEKQGPHFAVGDTCFSHEEDLITYNPDGKQMIAKDNTCSIKRKTDPENAYFNCHTDITIPYSELGDVVVIKKNGETIDILKNGRFALPATLPLNKAIDEALS